MQNAITIDALRALDAIERNGSFAAAAASLYKVPSALTYTIKKLEDDLGTALFDRTKQRAQLTPAGKLVLEQGRDILLATNRLMDSVQQLESGWESEIRLSRDTIISPLPLFSLLEQFNQLEQNVNITVGVEAVGGGWDALHSRRADIIIGASGEPPRGLFQTHKIGEIEFVFAIAAHHALAFVDGVLEAEQLSHYTGVVVADTSKILPTRDTGIFKSKQMIRVNTMQDKIAAQVRGLGIGFLPLHLARPYLESGELIQKPCSIPRQNQSVYLSWHRGQQGRAFEWFIEHLPKVNWGL